MAWYDLIPGVVPGVDERIASAKKGTIPSSGKTTSFLVPPISPAGGVSIFQKMFGTAQPATQGFPWLVAGGGAVLGAGTALFFGKKGSDQTQAVTQQQQPIQITKTISPVTTTTSTNTYANTYQIMENSPGSSQSMNKKDTIETSPSIGVSPTWAISPSQAASQAATQGQTASQGTDLILLAAIAAVGIVGFGYFSGKKKHKGAK